MLMKFDVNGTRLSAYVTGQGEPLLFVHGFPLDHHMWEAQVHEFAQTHHVIAVDLRGFGASAPAEGTTTMQQFADDCAAVLDALKVEQLVTLCGLSMGGYVAWQFIERHSDRLARLVLCDTRAIADSAEGAAGRHTMAARVVAEGSDVVATAMLPKLFAARTQRDHPELIERAKQMIARASSTGIAAALRGMAQRPDVTARLPSIRVPTLVIVGQEDAISTVDEMRAVANSIPNAELVVVPDAGHMSPMENANVVNAALRKFL
ncbi:MAG TPA: alpha/beta fold hydrolase [Pirellulales bacterium]|jgi:pimeloyl-ACP methyl ester carboxylesterase|nr:alpha/beta fold hydrolase [Pirellulales bacterium]